MRCDEVILFNGKVHRDRDGRVGPDAGIYKAVGSGRRVCRSSVVVYLQFRSVRFMIRCGVNDGRSKAEKHNGMPLIPKSEATQHASSRPTPP